MKIPKTLKIFGYTWKVKIVKDLGGGDFTWRTKTLRVGYKNGTKQEIEEIFFHEILELIMTHLKYRFYGQENSMEYVFHFDHTGLCRIHQALYQVLKDNNII